MAQFLHSFPEVQDNGTPFRMGPGFQMNGDFPVINGVPFEKLRRHQLANLARAWKIPVDLDAPKQDMLPALTAAARQGAFRKQPKLPYYAWKATWTGDERMPLDHPHFEYPDGIPEPKIEPEALPSEVKKILDPEEQKFRQMYASWSYHDLKREAKRVKPDLNLYGVSRVALGRLLCEHGVGPDNKPE